MKTVKEIEERIETYKSLIEKFADIKSKNPAKEDFNLQI